MTRYANGAYQRASGTRSAFAGLSADLVAEGYPEITVNSGDRETELQEQIFRDKFVPSSGPKDAGPFNDRRLWPGHGYWKRVKGGGTVGVPGTSNHEKRRAADLAYPYNSSTAAHRRAQVLAKRHNITCEGLGFSEWWHWTFWGPLGTIDQPGQASGNSTSTSEGFLMALSDEQQNQMYNALVKGGYGGYYATDATIKILREEIAPAIAGIAAGGVNFPGAPYNAFVAVVNATREANGQAPVEVDEAALAASLAPALAPLIAANLGTLTDETVNDLVNRLLGEQAKRLAS